MASEFRIDYVICRRQDGDGEFTEIGFGSSGAWDSTDAAVDDVQAAVQNHLWETEPGQPDPSTVNVSDL